MKQHAAQELTGLEVAIVGLTGRFPGAATVDELWRNLRGGVESIVRFDDEELLAAGIDPTLIAHPAYVKASGALADIELFDASFFGYSPREAEIIDPQQRLFLECAWEALEISGCDPRRYPGWIGVYAGSALSAYYLQSLSTNQDLLESVGFFQVSLANSQDFLAPRVSYKLDLKGPSISVQTACSTSLVAVHLACQGLLRGDCDLALAGGVSIGVPQTKGYLYQEGGILSPDGHCRPFDAAAQGCVGGNGVGIVVLKRLEDALEEGDVVRAIIKGTAVNNDGGVKVGFTAPQVDGQSKVIRSAQLVAEVDPETITYVQAHGTATDLGDPIEVAALTQAFGASTDKHGFCALGSVKCNLGHLDAAAGVTGLIQTVLALEHREIPPTLHFERPNPRIDFENSPFRVSGEVQAWNAPEPRRAGVSSFGIGGTNAHVILEEAAERPASGPSRERQLLVTSARTNGALEKTTDRLASYLEAHPEANLADVAFTLQTGRAAFEHRRALVATNVPAATAILRGGSKLLTGARRTGRHSVAFLFPGQGTQHPAMAAELYRSEESLRREIDTGCEILAAHLGRDLRQLLYPPQHLFQEAAFELRQTALAQPALFLVEHALAKLWMSWGVQPAAMLGHSIGEYVAACLAGVFSFEDGLRLVAERGRLMQELERGAMMAVSMTEDDLAPWLGEDVSLAAVNGPQLCVVGGNEAAVTRLEARLLENGTGCQRLRTSHAFHSAAVEPIIETFTAVVANLGLGAPKIPFLSNVTGSWIRDDEATDPAYWGRHLRQTVRFDEGLQTLLSQPGWALLEVGPGQSLTTLVSRHPRMEAVRTAVASCRRPQDEVSDLQQILAALGQLWVDGAEVDWAAFSAEERRHRVVLPTYPFERQRFWVEARRNENAASGQPAQELTRLGDTARWFHRPTWRQTALPRHLGHEATRETPLRWLLFVNGSGLNGELVERLRQRGDAVVMVLEGERFADLGEGAYAVGADRRKDFCQLLRAIEAGIMPPQRIVYLWSVGEVAKGEETTSSFYDLLSLAQALGDEVIGFRMESGEAPPEMHLAAVSDGLHSVLGDEPLRPLKAALLGPIKVIPQEYPRVTCSTIDIVVPSSAKKRKQLAMELESELAQPTPDAVVAYRGTHRWLQDFEPVPLASPMADALPLRPEGVYLLTGGLGGMGLEFASYLAKEYRASLVLVGRSGLPPREQWTTTDPQQRRLLELEAAGAELLVMTADVADREAMAAVLEAIQRRFGALHGVIHAAGIGGGGVMQMMTPEIAAKGLRAKIDGTLVLSQLLEGKKLDFAVLCSSHRSILGGARRVEYCAANAFLDAFAHAADRLDGCHWVAINWDGWSEVGMAVEAAEHLAREEEPHGGLSCQEGIEALRRVLATRLPQVIVATLPFLEELAAERSATAATALQQLASTQRFQVQPRPELSTDYSPATTSAERALAEIWSELLGIEPVGINDNFLELGGDSLISLQVVAKASQRGLGLSARQVFEFQTIADLAAVAGSAIEVKAEQGLVTGEVPLTPIQHDFFARPSLHPGHYNQSVLVEVHVPLDAAALRGALEEILRHHDALRLRFVEEPAGWRQFHAPTRSAAPFGLVDLSRVQAADRPAAIESVAARAQSSLDLARGPLLRLVGYDLGADQPWRLLVIVHHLAIDVVSWPLLLEDLATTYTRMASGEAPELPAKTTSFQHWAELLTERAGTTEATELLRDWVEQPWETVAPLPLDLPGGENRSGHAVSVTVELDEDQTRRLTQDVPQVFRARAQDLLVASLAETLARFTGSNTVALDMEGHGREAIFDGVDLSRTVGWFTCIYPALLELPARGGLEERLKAVKEQLRQIPRGGLDFGLMRYMSPRDEIRQQLALLPAPEVVFLYTGQGADTGPNPGFSPAAESSGPNLSPDIPRSHLLEVTATVHGGRLQLIWTYSREHHHETTVAELSSMQIKNLQDLIDHCLSSTGVGYTPSDFPEAGLDQAELDALVAELDEGGWSESG